MRNDAVLHQPISIQCRDGRELSGHLFEHATNAPRFTVLINGAIGVQQGFYRAVAQHLAANGALVLTYDYRGIGGSRLADQGSETGTLSDWGRLDTVAAINVLLSKRPNLPICVLGHSAGGQILGLAENVHNVRAVWCVGSQSGYWGHWPLQIRPLLVFLWFLLVPGLTKMLGCFPMRSLGLGTSDLPRSVALQWAQWCRTPSYLLNPSNPADQRGFDRYRGDLRLVCISDDWMAPVKSVRALAGFYRKANVHVSVLQSRSLGHFGYFKRHSTVQWEVMTQWFQARVCGKV